MNQTLSQIDPRSLAGAVVLLDIDGTLVPDGSTEIDQATETNVRQVIQVSEVHLVSNGANAEYFSRLFNCSYLDLRKPFGGKGRSILKDLKAAGRRLVVVGDKFLTDGLFAKSIGGEFMKVKRVIGVKTPFAKKVAYALDDVAWKKMHFIRLARPASWIKNLLVFTPLFFAPAVFDTIALWRTVVAALAFCFAGSFVYILNDAIDREEDKSHPRKNIRPLASGDVSSREATILAIIWLALLSGSIYLVPVVFWPLGVYVILNLIYSFRLKRVAVLDIALVALFYPLRIFAGGLAAMVPLSPWIILCTFFGALFVIVGKRKAEQEWKTQRAVLDQYSREALNLMLGIAASLAIIAYGIWTVVEHDSPYLVYSVIFVIIALLRMLNVVYTRPLEAEFPEVLVFRDKWILASFLSWIFFVFIIFYAI